MRMDVTGGFSIGAMPMQRSGRRYQLSDDVSLIRGNHQMAFGDVAQWRTTSGRPTNRRNLYIQRHAIIRAADFLLGRLTTMRQASPTLWSAGSHVAMFAADTWKSRPDDYELGHGGSQDSHPFDPGAVYHFDDTRNQGTKSTVYPNTGRPLFRRSRLPGKLIRESALEDLAPRVGLAWDVQGNGRTSVRASYGYAYDLGTGQTLAASSSAPPWALRTMYQSPPGGFEDPWAGYEGGNPFPYIPAKGAAALFPTFATYAPLLRYSMTPPATQSWNLSVQRQVRDDLLVSASYLGSHTTHLWMQQAINQAVYLGTGPCTIAGVAYPTCSVTGNTGQRRRLFLQNSQQGQYYGIIAAIEDGGSASYNGLLLTIQRRAVRGLNFGANYTWSHCLGDEEYNAGGAAGGGYLIPTTGARLWQLLGRSETGAQLDCSCGYAAVWKCHTATSGDSWRLSGIYRNSTAAD
jgi:hypothetical protein